MLEAPVSAVTGGGGDSAWVPPPIWWADGSDPLRGVGDTLHQAIPPQCQQCAWGRAFPGQGQAGQWQRSGGAPRQMITCLHQVSLEGQQRAGAGDLGEGLHCICCR